MGLIALSGKIQSGKDTVGRIIQYLHFNKMYREISYADYCNIYHLDYNTNMPSSWKIVKFADALKNIIVILTGCTREQLEDNDFKESYLSKEWNLDNSDDIPNSYNNLTYRELLQQIGTNLFRDNLHNDVWINALFSKYKGIQQTTISKDCPRQGIYDVTEADELQYGSIEIIYPNWIITDCRFPNEAKAVKDRKGIVIRVNRPINLRFPKIWNMFISDNKIKHTIGEFMGWLLGVNDEMRNLHAKFNHPSETALDDYTFDYVIDNNESIEDLIEKVKDILIKEKLI